MHFFCSLRVLQNRFSVVAKEQVVLLGDVAHPSTDRDVLQYLKNRVIGIGFSRGHICRWGVKEGYPGTKKTLKLRIGKKNERSKARQGGINQKRNRECRVHQMCGRLHGPKLRLEQLSGRKSQHGSVGLLKTTIWSSRRHNRLGFEGGTSWGVQSISLRNGEVDSSTRKSAAQPKTSCSTFVCADVR